MSAILPVQHPEPTEEHLRDLHRAYHQFMRAQPWKELTERNSFIINNQNEQDQENICIVMGHWQEEFGLSIVKGPNAKTATSKTLRENVPAIEDCPTTAITTGEAKHLHKQERDTIRKLGFKYRKHWPVWFSTMPIIDDPILKLAVKRNTVDISDHDAVILERALRAATDIVEKARNDKLQIHTDERPDINPKEPIPAFQSVQHQDGSWSHSAINI